MLHRFFTGSCEKNIQQGRRVFFEENRIVHWGAYQFGQLLIETDDDIYEIFDDYIGEIRFEPIIDEEMKEGFLEIKLENIEDIKYILHYI